jgi:hypothetical protein
MLIKRMSDLEQIVDSVKQHYEDRSSYEERAILDYGLGTITIIKDATSDNLFIRIPNAFQFNIKNISSLSKSELLMEFWLKLNQTVLYYLYQNDLFYSTLADQIDRHLQPKRVKLDFYGEDKEITVAIRNSFIVINVQDTGKDHLEFQFEFMKGIGEEGPTMDKNFNLTNIFSFFTSFLSFLKIAIIKYDL